MTVQKGELYRRNYLKKDELEKDSTRFRCRIGAYFNQKLDRYNNLCGKTIWLELGVKVRVCMVSNGIVTYDIAEFLEEAEIIDVIGSITIIYKVSKSKNWKEFVEKAFREEGLDYTLDEECGVHPYVDAEFQQNKTATLRCLQKEELKGVKHEFEQAFDKLNSSRQDNKGAIKAINEAVESLVKGLNDVGSPETLGQALSKLGGFINKIYCDDEVELKASKEILESLNNWNKSCHNYRHGKDADKINNPSDEYTILMLSQGASYIRWLLDVEQLYIKAKESGQQK